MLTLGNLKGGRYRLGVWRGGVTLVTPGSVWCFRPPWNRPLFSERHNIDIRHVLRLGGWRLFARKVS